MPKFQNIGFALGQFQGGTIMLEGLGCGDCGKGFFLEADAQRKVPDGRTLSCPHCSALKVVNRGS
jgi:DNA-directed RNA polymerase subunit RPC12/RpoP